MTTFKWMESAKQFWKSQQVVVCKEDGEIDVLMVKVVGVGVVMLVGVVAAMALGKAVKQMEKQLGEEKKKRRHSTTG